KKLEAEAERALRQGRRMQKLGAAADANDLLAQLDPLTELVTVDDAQHYDDQLLGVLNDLATLRRLDVVAAGWELDYAGRAAGPMPELLCSADFALKLDDGVCAQPGRPIARSAFRRLPCRMSRRWATRFETTPG